jgi:hypothetical protein
LACGGCIPAQHQVTVTRERAYTGDCWIEARPLVRASWKITGDQLSVKLERLCTRPIGERQVQRETERGPSSLRSLGGITAVAGVVLIMAAGVIGVDHGLDELGQSLDKYPESEPPNGGSSATTVLVLGVGAVVAGVVGLAAGRDTETVRVTRSRLAHRSEHIWMPSRVPAVLEPPWGGHMSASPARDGALTFRLDPAAIRRNDAATLVGPWRLAPAGLPVVAWYPTAAELDAIWRAAGPNRPARTGREP